MLQSETLSPAQWSRELLRLMGWRGVQHTAGTWIDAAGARVWTGRLDPHADANAWEAVNRWIHANGYGTDFAQELAARQKGDRQRPASPWLHCMPLHDRVAVALIVVQRARVERELAELEAQGKKERGAWHRPRV